MPLRFEHTFLYSPGASGGARTPSELQNSKSSFGYPKVSSEGFKMFPDEKLVEWVFLTLFPKLIDKKQENSLKITFLGIICILCGTPYENPSEASMGQN